MVYAGLPQVVSCSSLLLGNQVCDIKSANWGDVRSEETIQFQSEPFLLTSGWTMRGRGKLHI